MGRKIVRIIRACELLEQRSSGVLTSNAAAFKNFFMSNKSGVHLFEFVNAMHVHLLTGWPKIMAGKPALYILWVIRFTLLLVEKAGVAPDVAFRFTACKQVRVQVREPPWLWNPYGGLNKVQNRSNQWPHKMNLGPTKISWWGGMIGGGHVRVKILT